MKIYLGTDHAGYELKEKIKKLLQDSGYEVEDCGAHEFNKEDDFTDFITPVAKKINEEPESKGIILGGSGQAEAMLANKFPNVRAAEFYGPVLAKEPIEVEGTESNDDFAIIRLTRLHNNANILSIGARFVTEEQVLHAVTLWLDTPFSEGERHKRRIEKIKEIAVHIWK